MVRLLLLLLLNLLLLCLLAHADETGPVVILATHDVASGGENALHLPPVLTVSNLVTSALTVMTHGVGSTFASQVVACGVLLDG